MGCTVATRFACEIVSTSPESTRHRFSSRRSGTTLWRGEMLPAAASGRNGWYVMCGCGSTTVISASVERSLRERCSAA
jgi:hypothetical protein